MLRNDTRAETRGVLMCSKGLRSDEASASLDGEQVDVLVVEVRHALSQCVRR
jgi:hypothetical protein